MRRPGGLRALHGGTLEARSEGLGKGSEFLVRLPFASAAPVVAARENVGRGAEGRPSGHRILIVDDNRDFASSLETLLLGLGVWPTMARKDWRR